MIPLGVIVQPLAAVAPREQPIDLIDLGMSNGKGPLRCSKCGAYINCHVQFAEEGNKWICNLCQNHNEVPSFYYCHLDAYGQRRDRDSRPEFGRGSVDFVAPEEYCLRPPKLPPVVFMIDVSRSSIQSGMFAVAIASIKRIVNNCTERGTKTKFGVITFGQRLHFFNLNTKSNEPKMCVVPDVGDPFAPLPQSDWLIDAVRVVLFIHMQ
jgi:protein transport protein SEC24